MMIRLMGMVYSIIRNRNILPTGLILPSCIWWRIVGLSIRGISRMIRGVGRARSFWPIPSIIGAISSMIFHMGMAFIKCSTVKLSRVIGC